MISDKITISLKRTSQWKTVIYGCIFQLKLSRKWDIDSNFKEKNDQEHFRHSFLADP